MSSAAFTWIKVQGYERTGTPYFPITKYIRERKNVLASCSTTLFIYLSKMSVEVLEDSNEFLPYKDYTSVSCHFNAKDNSYIYWHRNQWWFDQSNSPREQKYCRSAIRFWKTGKSASWEHLVSFAIVVNPILSHSGRQITSRIRCKKQKTI